MGVGTEQSPCPEFHSTSIKYLSPFLSCPIFVLTIQKQVTSYGLKKNVVLLQTTSRINEWNKKRQEEKGYQTVVLSSHGQATTDT